MVNHILRHSVIESDLGMLRVVAAFENYQQISRPFLIQAFNREQRFDYSEAESLMVREVKDVEVS